MQNKTLDCERLFDIFNSVAEFQTFETTCSETIFEIPPKSCRMTCGRL